MNTCDDATPQDSDPLLHLLLDDIRYNYDMLC